MARAEEARSATHAAPADDVDAAAIRWFDPVTMPIARATDLGSVQVIKHGDLFLLTDPFGDVHVDSRGLGLYDRDTRLLSCSQLRVNGARPVLLQGSAGGNFRATIQLTNPTHRPQHRVQGEPARRPLRAKDRDRARPDAVARGSRRAAHGGELRRAPRDGHDRARARDRRRRHLRGPRAGARPARDAPPGGRASGAGDLPLRRPRRSPALDVPALQRSGRRDRTGRSASGRIRVRGLVAPPLDLAPRARPAA